MDTTIDDALDRIRPRDRGKVSGLLHDLADPGANAQTRHITVSRVGGGGVETQIARWEPEDGVGLVDWIGTVLDGQATEAAPATAKVRIRGWYTGSSPGRGATAVLLGTFVALLILTVITVAVAHVDLGSLNLLVAMAIASVKASVVVLFFMHLLYDRPFHGVMVIAALLAVVLFITFVLLDSKQYQPEMIAGHAPALQR